MSGVTLGLKDMMSCVDSAAWLRKSVLWVLVGEPLVFGGIVNFFEKARLNFPLRTEDAVLAVPFAMDVVSRNKQLFRYVFKN